MLSIFKGHRVLLAVSIFLSALLAGLSVGLAFILEGILNTAVNQDWAHLHRMVIIAVCYIVAAAVVLVSGSLLKKKLTVRTLQDMRQDVYNGIMSRDVEHFRAVNSADYISALTNDMKTIEENMLLAPLETISYLFVFLLSAAALFYYSPLVGGIMCVSLIAMYTLPASLGKPASYRQGLLSGSFAMFTTHLKDQLSGYDVIRSFQLADKSETEFAAQNRDISEKRYDVDKMVALSEGLSQILAAGTQFLVMLFSAYLVLKGNLTAGAMLGIVQLSGSFTQPVAIIMQGIPKIKGAQPVWERIRRLSEKQAGAFTGTAEPQFERNITFENVTFGYTPEQNIINDLSIVLEKNKKYALTGASGSGKTTFVRLLGAGFGGYSGQIKMDGLELRELDIAALLSNMSVIHQDVYMFDETVKENIGLHREHTQAEWSRALQVSGVQKFIGQLPDGLETQVGENGANLSGGQRQRIAVARALIENKPILILDEGTSGVDAPTAYDIETALLHTPDVTMLTITHNLGADLLRQYDQVLFMERGQIAEAGRYDELVGAGGGFSEFVRQKKDGTVEKNRRGLHAVTVTPTY